jgi:feruloyl esterase
MQTYYEGSVNPSDGAIINPGNVPGSETGNVFALGFAFNENLKEPAFDNLFKWAFDATWQWQTFDFNQNVTTTDQVLAVGLNANGTDLATFRDRGGKLILYAGWADPLVPSPVTINYFDTVAETMFGDLSTQGAKRHPKIPAPVHGARYVALRHIDCAGSWS